MKNVYAQAKSSKKGSHMLRNMEMKALLATIDHIQAIG
jgi:hypothetical protein